MAIKSDKWIIEQAQENQLITPFSSVQIREVDGEKIVSYGVSSYGYDVRCSNEFGGIMHSSAVTSTKLFGSKLFGSTIEE